MKMAEIEYGWSTLEFHRITAGNHIAPRGYVETLPWALTGVRSMSSFAQLMSERLDGELGLKS